MQDLFNDGGADAQSLEHVDTDSMLFHDPNFDSMPFHDPNFDSMLFHDPNFQDDVAKIVGANAVEIGRFLRVHKSQSRPEAHQTPNG